MDSVTKILMSKKFHVPREIMELIDDHLIIIYYKKQHYKKLPMYDGSDFCYLINRIYNIRCCMNGYDENENDFETEDEWYDYLYEWNKKCEKLIKYPYLKNDDSLSKIVIAAQHKLKRCNLKYWQ